MPWWKQKGKVGPAGDNSQPSLSSSMTSLTPSQLNLAVMNLLNVEMPRNNCQAACRGDPITAAGQRNQMLKMMAIILIPITILIGLTGNTFGIAIGNYIESNGIRGTLRFSVELAKLIRMLQRERDMSALYMSAIGPETKSFLLKRYIDTDEQIQNLSQWPVSERNTAVEFQSSESFLKYLNRHRYELESSMRTYKDELNKYTDWIEVFIKWFYQSVTEARTKTVWKALVAYQELLLASEFIGRERAMGVLFFIKGAFASREDYLYFVESQDSANVSFEAARQYSPIAREIFDRNLVQREALLITIREKREEIRAKNEKGSQTNGSLYAAEWWFENMTYYQDSLRETQSAVAEKIDRLLNELQNRDLTQIITISLIFTGICVLCPVITYAIYKLTREIQKTSINIADRTKALSKEKKRTDTLLYQMLPKAVAQRLKQNEEIQAEMFEASTIMLCDIVGFTDISARSSPLQIVEMLNTLYSCLDERIEMYDVYKVETIGDAYLVASGVPKPNGKRHAAEIAGLALDISEHAHHIEIPHIPGTNIRLRSGCHSGPVVAGIVGTKMPHYCLFGETVNIASKMEALGKASKIHLSQTTADLLTEIGGFVVQERQKFNGQVDEDLMLAFKGSIRTFWLVSREGYTPSTPDTSSL